MCRGFLNHLAFVLNGLADGSDNLPLAGPLSSSSQALVLSVGRPCGGPRPLPFQLGHGAKESGECNITEKIEGQEGATSPFFWV